MTKQHTVIILTSLIFGAYPAFAQNTKAPENAFHPVQSWSIGGTQNASVDSMTPAECSIRNEFNNGFILRFTGSSNWVQSLDINFRQNIFNKGQAYTTQISVPGIDTKNLKAHSTAKNIVSIPLKGHKNFYKSLRENAVLDVDVEGNAFRFYMTGFSGAAKNFEQCMAGQNMRAVPVPLQNRAIVKEASVKPVQKTIASLETQPFLVNESIALEQFESQDDAARNAIRDVSDNPAPVQRIAEQIIPQGAALRLSETEQGNTEIQNIAAYIPPNKKLSEQLAEEIFANPALAEIDVDVPNRVAKTPAAIIPPSPVEAQDIVALSSADKIEPVQIERAQDALPEIPAAAAITPVTQAANEVVVQTERPKNIISNATQNRNVEAIIPQTPQPIRQAEPIRTESVLKTIVKNNTAPKTVVETAEKIAPPLAPLPKAEPPQAEIITNAEIQAAPTPLPLPEQALAAAPIPVVQETVPAISIVKDAVKDVPLVVAAPIERIESVEALNDYNAAQSSITVLNNPSQVEPQKIVVQEPIAQQPVVKSMQTPDIVVHKESIQTQADFTHLNAIEPASGNSARDLALLAQISSLEQTVQMLKSENNALSSELNVSVEEKETERLSISSQDWDLERATMRYNEAERQIRRLGQQLQKERTQWNFEKQELETMLFDPEVADAEQIARLSKLEQELNAAQKELERYKKGVNTPGS